MHWYFHTSGNQFDCFITIASVADTAVTLFYGLDVAPDCEALGVLRALRVFRLVKLVLIFPGTAPFYRALERCFNSIYSVIILYTILLIMFGIIGCAIFIETR